MEGKLLAVEYPLISPTISNRISRMNNNNNNGNGNGRSDHYDDIIAFPWNCRTNSSPRQERLSSSLVAYAGDLLLSNRTLPDREEISI